MSSGYVFLFVPAFFPSVSHVLPISQNSFCWSPSWLSPGSGRSPGGGNGNSLQYSCLENPMDGGTWWAIVHGVAKSRTQLSDIWVWLSWLSNACNSRKDPESKWLARNQPHYYKTQDGNHVAEQSSWVLLSFCFPPECLFAIKSFALSAPVFPWTIHLQVLDKGPLSCPGRGPPFLQHSNQKLSWNYHYRTEYQCYKVEPSQVAQW